MFVLIQSLSLHSQCQEDSEFRFFPEVASLSAIPNVFTSFRRKYPYSIIRILNNTLPPGAADKNSIFQHVVSTLACLNQPTTKARVNGLVDLLYEMNTTPPFRFVILYVTLLDTSLVDTTTSLHTIWCNFCARFSCVEHTCVELCNAQWKTAWLTLLQQYEPKPSSSIATCEQCCLRFKKQSATWHPNEDVLLCQALRSLPNQYCVIAKVIFRNQKNCAQVFTRVVELIKQAKQSRINWLIEHQEEQACEEESEETTLLFQKPCLCKGMCIWISWYQCIEGVCSDECGCNKTKCHFFCQCDSTCPYRQPPCYCLDVCDPKECPCYSGKINEFSVIFECRPECLCSNCKVPKTVKVCNNKYCSNNLENCYCRVEYTKWRVWRFCVRENGME